MTRKVGKRQILPPRKRAIGAGITEYWYLKHLKRILDLNIDLYPRLFGNESMPHIKKLINESLKDGVDIVCLFDEDVKQWNDVESQRIKDLHIEFDDNEHVILGSSMPSIEYWFLLHYEKTNRHFKTSKDASKALRKYIPEYEKKKDFLYSEKWVYSMLKDNRLETALDRAEFFGRQDGMSYTDVWKVIKKIK